MDEYSESGAGYRGHTYRHGTDSSPCSSEYWAGRISGNPTGLPEAGDSGGLPALESREGRKGGAGYGKWLNQPGNGLSWWGSPPWLLWQESYLETQATAIFPRQARNLQSQPLQKLRRPNRRRQKRRRFSPSPTRKPGKRASLNTALCSTSTWMRKRKPRSTNYAAGTTASSAW